MNEIDAYRSLGYAIIQTAVEDYEDVLCILELGYNKEIREKLYKAVIGYGEKRSTSQYRSVKGRLTRIKNLIKQYESKAEAEATKKELERFFHSDWFDVLTPGIDGERIIKTVRRRVMEKKNAQN